MGLIYNEHAEEVKNIDYERTEGYGNECISRKVLDISKQEIIKANTVKVSELLERLKKEECLMIKYKGNEIDEITIDITDFEKIEEQKECSYDEYIEDIFEGANITGFGYIDYPDDGLIRIRFEMDTNIDTLKHIINFYQLIKSLIKGTITLGIDYESFVGDYNSENISFEDINLADFKEY